MLEHYLTCRTARHSPELEIYLWEYQKVLSTQTGPPVIISASAVVSQACRITLRRHHLHSFTDVDVDEDADTVDQPLGHDDDNDDQAYNVTEDPNGTLVWVTIGLTRVRLYYELENGIYGRLTYSI